MTGQTFSLRRILCPCIIFSAPAHQDLPITSRRRTRRGPEAMAEVRQVRIAACIRDLLQGQGGGLQQRARQVEAALGDPGRRRHAERHAEHARQVKLRQAGRLRQRAERDGLCEVRVDVVGQPAAQQRREAALEPQLAPQDAL